MTVPPATLVTRPASLTVAIVESEVDHAASAVTSTVDPSENPATAVAWYSVPTATNVTVSEVTATAAGSVGAVGELDVESSPHDVATMTAANRAHRNLM